MKLCSFCNQLHHRKFDESKEECYICNNKLEGLEEFLEKTNFKKHKTFCISTFIPKKWLVNEEEVWETDFSESIKNYVNKKIVSHIIKKTGSEYSTKSPNRFVFDLRTMSYHEETEGLFVFGRYKKLIAGISQTRWACKRCNGKGCSECGEKGKNYESIEEIIGEVFRKYCNCRNYFLHASGREDTDVTNTAGRPFVFELIAPKEMDFSLGLIEDDLKNGLKKEVEVYDLKFVDRTWVELVSNSHFNKQYSAVIKIEKEINEQDIEKIMALKNRIIEQRTPTRVAHRRADKIRKRKVLDAATKKISNETVEILFTTEAGTYIKELVSGDEGRTNPSVSSILNCKAECEKLIVTKIYDEFLN